jgi:hypothetical protein
MTTDKSALPSDSVPQDETGVVLSTETKIW